MGIETSCDETAVGIVKNGTEILSNTIQSSLILHKKTQGVVPEVAARDAFSKILSVVDTSLSEANCTWADIDIMACTNGPGLAGSLMVGIETARTLAYIYDKPLVPVQHISGHMYSNVLGRDIPRFPVLVLTVSGGHNNLILWKNYFEFELLGETLDDASGEAFDKVGKMLGLDFPGGPEIEKLAKKGNPKAFDFPRPMAQKSNLDFSYSGIKTAMVNQLRKIPELTDQVRADLAASFQEAVVESLLIKLKKAHKIHKTTTIYLSGGVSCNERLQQIIKNYCDKIGVELYCPIQKILSTDNGAMIASAGYFKYNHLKSDWNYKNTEMNLSHDLV